MKIRFLFWELIDTIFVLDISTFFSFYFIWYILLVEYSGILYIISYVFYGKYIFDDFREND